MLGEARQPFFAADNVGRPHEMVVNRMGEMIRRNTVGFQEDKVLFILGKFKLSAHKIRAEHLFFSVSRSKYSQNKRVAVFQVFFDFF